MALPQQPLTQEQMAKLSEAFAMDYLSRPSPLFSAISEPAKHSQSDALTFRFPWRVRLSRFWDRLLKRVGVRKPEPTTVSYSQVITYEFATDGRPEQGSRGDPSGRSVQSPGLLR